MILSTLSKKPYNFVGKTKDYLKKTPNDLEKLHPDFSEERKERMKAGFVGVFCQNLGIIYSIYFRKLFI